jgi:hypothetical protein
MAARHSNRRRGGSTRILQSARELLARVDQLSADGGSRSERTRLVAASALLTLLVEGLRHRVPPFNKPASPLFRRWLELARDVAGDEIRQVSVSEQQRRLTSPTRPH